MLLLRETTRISILQITFRPSSIWGFRMGRERLSMVPQLFQSRYLHKSYPSWQTQTNHSYKYIRKEENSQAISHHILCKFSNPLSQFLVSFTSSVKNELLLQKTWVLSDYSTAQSNSLTKTTHLLLPVITSFSGILSSEQEIVYLSLETYFYMNVSSSFSRRALI